MAEPTGGDTVSRVRALAPMMLWAMCAAAPACQQDPAPRPQWVIEVGTDAPVPLVGDHVLIELLDADGVLACPSCRRDAPAARKEDWAPLSFGVQATSNAVYLRTRMYRGDHIDQLTGQPDPALTIDNLVRLPANDGQVITVYVGLLLDCLGMPSTLPGDGGTAMQTCSGAARTMAEPVVASQQALGLSLGASKLLDVLNRTCAGPGDEQMACIPGGVFFLGSALAPAPHADVNAAPIPERLVGVSSFLIDRLEVGYEEFAAWMKTKPYGCDDNVRCRGGNDLRKYCVHPPPGSTERITAKLPMNCISWARASEYCADQGKRLPTEVEWEYVASNGSQDTRFAWGDDTPSCDMAVLARDFESKPGEDGKSGACVRNPPLPGPAAVESVFGSRDRTLSFGGSPDNRVYGLAGNVAEWTADVFQVYGDKSTCWKGDGSVIFRPKACDSGAAPVHRSVRGGSWLESLQAAWSANRSHVSEVLIVSTPDVGFRCACDLDPAANPPACAK